MKKLKKAAMGILVGALCAASTAGVTAALAPAEAKAEVSAVQSPNIMTPTKLDFNKTYKKNIRGDKDGAYYYFTTDSSGKPYTVEIFNDIGSSESIEVYCYEMNADNNNQYSLIDQRISVNNRYQKTLEIGTERGMLKPNCKYMIRVEGYHPYYYHINPIFDNENFFVHIKIAHDTGTSTFSDVKKSDWYYKPVEWAAAVGIATGSNGKFNPNQACTREAAVTFLWRMAGRPEPRSMTSKFSDVKDKNRYSYKAIMWATEKGIITGKYGKFQPKATCTREQIVTMLWRLEGSPTPASMTSSFKDVKNKKSYSYKAILWANQKGISTGGSGKFYPASKCKRCDIVTFIYRYKN